MELLLLALALITWIGSDIAYISLNRGEKIWLLILDFIFPMLITIKSLFNFNKLWPVLCCKLLAIGFFVLAFGVGDIEKYREYKSIVNVNYHDIEIGKNYDAMDIRIGEHYKVYPFSFSIPFDHVLFAELDKYMPGREISETYYPIVSMENAWSKEVDRLVKIYGRLESIPKNKIPPLKKIYAFGRIHSYKKYKDVPRVIQKSSELVGGVSLVKDNGTVLTDALKTYFIKADFSQVQILDEGSAPEPPQNDFYPTLIIGIALVLIPGMLLIKKIVNQ